MKLRRLIWRTGYFLQKLTSHFMFYNLAVVSFSMIIKDQIMKKDERIKLKNLMTTDESAVYLSVEPGTLAVWRSTGRYQLPFIKTGRLVRYSKNALDAWLEARTCKSGSTDGGAR